MTVRKALLGFGILVVLMGVAGLPLASAPLQIPLPITLLSDYGVTRISASGTVGDSGRVFVQVSTTVGPIFVIQLQVQLSSIQLGDFSLLDVVTDDFTIVISPSPVVIPTGAQYGEVVSKITNRPGPQQGLLVKEPMGNLAIPGTGSISVELVVHGFLLSHGTVGTVIVTISGPSTAAVTAAVRVPLL